MFLPNLKVDSEQLPKKVIVCGDPDRAQIIATKLTNSHKLASNREYHTYVGTYNDTLIGVVSHGVGAPGAAVCFEQLIQGGVEEIIRVGTAGSYQSHITPGSLIISTASVREDGLTKQLVPEGYPAVSNQQVVTALQRAAADLNINVRQGITLTLDAFYSGVIPFPHSMYKEAGVVAAEMEIAALYVIASLRGVKAGAIVAIDGFADADLAADYNPSTDAVKKAIENEAIIAIKAIATL